MFGHLSFLPSLSLQSAFIALQASNIKFAVTNKQFPFMAWWYAPTTTDVCVWFFLRHRRFYVHNDAKLFLSHDPSGTPSRQFGVSLTTRYASSLILLASNHTKHIRLLIVLLGAAWWQTYIFLLARKHHSIGSLPSVTTVGKRHATEFHSQVAYSHRGPYVFLPKPFVTTWRLLRFILATTKADLLASRSFLFSTFLYTEATFVYL